MAEKWVAYRDYGDSWGVASTDDSIGVIADRLTEANAQRIVAAHEMLDVLEAVESTLDCGEDGTGWYFIGASLAKEVSDAIVKAKGAG